MEEIEVPTEHLQEEIHHRAHMSEARWMSWVALSSAILAVLAAVAALLAGDNSNEAMIEQIQASDQWAYYQAKGIKAEVLEAKMQMLAAEGKPVSEEDKKKAEDYKEKKESITEVAKEKEASSMKHLRKHVVFARGVALFQVAIGVAAISVLTRRRLYWFVGLALGATGLFFLIQGLIS